MDVLLDRGVKFIDEVEEIIQERGGQTRAQTMASVHAAFPPQRIWQSHNEQQRALDAAIARHKAEVEAPAVAILRERKAAAAASRTTTSSGWRKEPVTFEEDDAGYYRELLDGVDPVLPEQQQLAAAPAVNSLTLRVSWPPRHCAATGFIASAHESLLALCVGSRHEDWRRHEPGCYLVLDTRAKSVSVVPPLPYGCDSVVDNHSHFPIGSAGVAVLRTDAHDGGGGSGGYLLAELYRHADPHRKSYLSTNTATLFTWCSRGAPRAGADADADADADQWIRKEVVLPLPVPGSDKYFSHFNAGTVFAVSSTALCWADVWAGFLVCDNISTDAADAGGDDDDGPVFRFIPLPEGCAPASYDSTEYRAVCCVDSETIKLLCMDDGDGENVTMAVTTWTLRSPLTDGWRWEKDEDASCSSLCVADLLDDAIIPADGGGNNRRRSPLLRRVRCPVIGRAQPGVAHVSVIDFEYKRTHGDWEWEARRCYEVSLDVPRRRVASVFTFPALSSPALVAL